MFFIRSVKNKMATLGSPLEEPGRILPKGVWAYGSQAGLSG
jgi:hypothetical protein